MGSDSLSLSLSSFFFVFVPHSPPPSVTVHMMQVHQISSLWEECQKHSKQYIKNTDRNSSDTAKNHRLWTYNDTTNITVQVGGGWGWGDPGTSTTKKQKKPVQIKGYYCLIKDENRDFFIFFKNSTGSFFTYFFCGLILFLFFVIDNRNEFKTKTKQKHDFSIGTFFHWCFLFSLFFFILLFRLTAWYQH